MYPVPAAFEGLIEPRRGALGRATAEGMLLCADALLQAERSGARRELAKVEGRRVKSLGTNTGRPE